MNVHASVLAAFWRRTRTGEGPVPLLAHEVARRASVDDATARCAINALRTGGYIASSRVGKHDGPLIYAVTERGAALLARRKGGAA